MSTINAILPVMKHVVYDKNFHFQYHIMKTAQDVPGPLILQKSQQSSVRILSPCPSTTYLVSDRRPCPCSPLQQRLGG